MGYMWNKSNGGIVTTWKTSDMATLTMLEPIANQVSKLLKIQYPKEFNIAMKSRHKIWKNNPWTGIAINFTVEGEGVFVHIDNNDLICCVLTMGEFVGGQFVNISKKQLINMGNGTAWVFQSADDYHGAYGVEKGLRIAIIFFVHKHLLSQSCQELQVYTPLQKRNISKKL